MNRSLRIVVSSAPLAGAVVVFLACGTGDGVGAKTGNATVGDPCSTNADCCESCGDICDLTAPHADSKGNTDAPGTCAHSCGGCSDGTAIGQCNSVGAQCVVSGSTPTLVPPSASINCAGSIPLNNCSSSSRCVVDPVKCAAYLASDPTCMPCGTNGMTCAADQSCVTDSTGVGSCANLCGSGFADCAAGQTCVYGGVGVGSCQGSAGSTACKADGDCPAGQACATLDDQFQPVAGACVSRVPLCDGSSVAAVVDPESGTVESGGLRYRDPSAAAACTCAPTANGGYAPQPCFDGGPPPDVDAGGPPPDAGADAGDAD